MEPISLSLGVLGIIISAFSNPVYDWIKQSEPILEKAYKKALKQWAKNDCVREKHANSLFSNIQHLKDQILTPDFINNPEMALLINYWIEELQKTDNSFLIETLSRANYETVSRIEINQNAEFTLILEKLDILVSSEELTTKRKLSPKRYDKPNPYIERKLSDTSNFLDAHFYPTKFDFKPLVDFVVSGNRSEEHV